MPHESFLPQILVLLIAAVAGVSLFERLRVGSVIGYLIAGIVIGPGGFAIVSDIADMQEVAELGVVFLLFTIGLEFTREQLRLVSSRVYALGALQIVLTAAAIAGIANVLGLDWGPAVIIGGALALSSTAVVLPVLNDLGKMNTTSGRTTVAVLLLQDLAVGPILVLIEALSADAGHFLHELGLAIVKAAIAIAVILVVGRLVLRPAFRIVARAKSPEVFVGMVLLVALGTAWATHLAGLSMAFGGFLAGLLLAETEFRHQVEADVQPFRGLLLGLFFLTVGMAVNLSFLADNLAIVVGLAVALMLGKFVITAALAGAFRFGRARAFRIGGLLAQGGEFAFVSFTAATIAGLLTFADLQMLFAVVTLTMILTPIVLVGGGWLAERLDRRRGRADSIIGDRLDVSRHVIIVGFGEVGAIVARMLRAYRVPYVVLDLSPERVRDGRLQGEPVYFGDATRADILNGVRASEALALVDTTGTPGVAEGLAAVRRHEFPDLDMLVRGGSEQAIMVLRHAGMTPVGQEATDTGLKLAGAILDLWHKETDKPSDDSDAGNAETTAADATAGRGK